MARPTAADSAAIVGHSCSAMPSRIAMTRAAYGSANSAMNSHLPGSANPSASSPASARNRGRSGSTNRREKAGFSRRRSRWWASPSMLRTQLAHQSANGPEVMPWWAGHSLLPCRRSGCRISRATWSYRSTARP